MPWKLRKLQHLLLRPGKELQALIFSRSQERLSLYLEYHPHVRSYQRGDASKAFAEAYHLTTPLGTPYRINYIYDGTKHQYLPDYIGTLVDGKLLIAEAGLEDEKSKGKPLAKAESARGLAQENGGVYWIGTEKNLPLSRHYNLQYLHIRRESFRTFHEIAPVLLANWPWGHFRTVKEFVKLLGSRWSDEEVETAVWKIVGDAMAQGRLLVDLTEVELSLSTQLALLDPDAPPILPDPLPSSLEEDELSEGDQSPLADDDSDVPLEVESLIPGPTIDTSEMGEEEKKQFEDKTRHNNRDGSCLRWLFWCSPRNPLNVCRSSLAQGQFTSSGVKYLALVSKINIDKVYSKTRISIYYPPFELHLYLFLISS